MISTVSLALGFMFLAGLLLLVLLDARMSWRIKAALIVVMGLATALFAYGIHGLRGYAVAANALPERFSLLWSVVHEPSPTNGDPGYIHVWLREPGGEPRAYALPYSRPLHERMEQARRRVADGQEVTMGTDQGATATGNPAAGQPSVPDFIVPPSTIPPKNP